MSRRADPQDRARKLARASRRSLPIGLFTPSSSSELPRKAPHFDLWRSIQGDRFGRNAGPSDQLPSTCGVRP